MKFEIFSAEKREALSKNGFIGLVAGIPELASFVVDMGGFWAVQKATEVGKRIVNARVPKFDKADFPTLESVFEYVEVNF